MPLGDKKESIAESGTLSAFKGTGLSELLSVLAQAVRQAHLTRFRKARIVWIQSGKPSGYEIGSVKERTCGCEANEK